MKYTPASIDAAAVIPVAFVTTACAIPVFAGKIFNTSLLANIVVALLVPEFTY